MEAYLGWAEEMGEDFVVRLGSKSHVVAVQSESVKRVLTDHEHFLRNVEPTKHLFRHGLLRLEGPVWKQRRATFTSSFRRQSMDAVVPIVQEETERLIEKWTDSPKSIRPTRDLSLTMLRVFGRFVLGFDFETRGYPGRAMHSALIGLTANSTITHMLGPKAAWLKTHREVAEAHRMLDRMCEDILLNADSTPFMTALRAALKDGQMQHRTAIDEIRGMLVAGHETSATGISWCVAMLSQHPELTGELREEGLAAERAQSYDEVQDLGATVRWCKETMRIYPPVPVSVSVTVKDTQLGRLSLPKGTRVDICSFALHRLAASWPAPEQFRPDRFLKYQKPGTYIPFLMGPHICLGKHLAMVELPIVTARLASAFEMQLPQGPPKPNLRISLHPKGFVLDVRARRTRQAVI